MLFRSVLLYLRWNSSGSAGCVFRFLH
ncbi:hypothetical protein V3C99_015741, partial [Haemonchus contortus]